MTGRSSCGGICRLAVFWMVSATVAAHAAILVDGQRVTVETTRYMVRLHGLSMTHIENRLTGERFASGTSELAGTGVVIRSLRPGTPDRLYRLSEQSKLTVEQAPNAVTLRYAGMGDGEHWEPNLTVALHLAIDPSTEDLLMTPTVHADIEQVLGVRDRGVLQVSMAFGPLGDALRLIVPASDGFSVTRDDTPLDWSYQANWPQKWEAALLIAEGQQGCMGLWADEPALRYGRQLALARADGWRVNLSFRTEDVIERCTDIRNATWRFNVFAGYWVKAASRYVQQMEAQWPDLQRLRHAKPDWADRVRVVLMPPTPSAADAARYAELLPRDSMAVFTAQEWLKGWNEGDIKAQKVGMDYFPNYPFENPTHYEAREDMPAKFAALEEMGIHIFPYTNPTCVAHGHPWLRQKLGPRHVFSYRIWQRMYPELCQRLTTSYRVSGIYEDCSWVLTRHLLGTPDGENRYNGSVRMRQYFRQLMPNVAVMGERNNEVTMRGQRFALSITQWPKHAHPINAYLFGPFLRMWNLQPQPAGFDADDVRGWMTPWPFQFEEQPMQERLMLRRRGIVFANEQLASVWPEQWDPDVMHYFRGKNGDDYRFVKRHGTRFVRITPTGEELIYWRLHGVASADVGDAGVQGWVGYSGARIIGLNPHAVYITLNDAERPPVTISSVPDGYMIRRCLVRDGFWLATVEAIKGKGEAGPVRLRVSGAKDLELKFCGAKSARRLGSGEYEVEMTVPGGLGVYWTEPNELDYDLSLSEFKARNTIQRKDSGVISRYGRWFHGAAAINQSDGDPTAGEEGSIVWLVHVPELGFEPDARPWLQFRYGTDHPYGDGANYYVRVNGQRRWHRYRPQVAETTRPDGQPEAPPLRMGAVDLHRYRGQVIVLELAVDGHRSGTSDSIRWAHVTLKATVAGTVETDDDNLPQGGAADDLLRD